MKKIASASLALAVTATAFIFAGPASAQAWPDKPVRMVVGFGAGGGTDIIARIVAQPLAEAFLRLPGVKGRAALLPVSVPGRALEGAVARHPWIDREAPVLAADFVAMDAGTGLVHIAPGHGEEDYELGRRAGLKIYNPVDDDGRFVPEVAHFAGQTVWEANPRIIEHLRSVGALVSPLTSVLRLSEGLSCARAGRVSVASRAAVRASVVFMNNLRWVVPSMRGPTRRRRHRCGEREWCRLGDSNT